LPNSISAGKWIWDFHEAVNSRLGKNGGPEFSSISPSGKIVDLWNRYETELRLSIMKGDVKGHANFKRHLLLWKGFVGL